MGVWKERSFDLVGGRNSRIFGGGIDGYHIVFVDIFLKVGVVVVMRLLVGAYDASHGCIISVAVRMLTRCTVARLPAALYSIRVLRGHGARLRLVVTSPCSPGWFGPWLLCHGRLEKR